MKVASKEPTLVGWQPIATAPRDGTRILGCYTGSYDAIEITYYDRRWLVDDPQHVWEPEWWMPLPEPPTNPTPGKEPAKLAPSEPVADNNGFRWHFRLGSCRVERRQQGTGYWHCVTGEIMLSMNPAELRAIADVIEGRAKE